MRVECWRVRLPQNPAKHPILIRPFNFQFLEFPPLKFRSYQADRQMPTWIVQGLDGNPVLVFPIFIAVCTVPSLQPFQVVRIHIISLPASTQLLINAETGQVSTATIHPVFKNNVSRLKDGGREGIRTPGLLIANGESLKLRRVATIS